MSPRINLSEPVDSSFTQTLSFTWFFLPRAAAEAFAFADLRVVLEFSLGFLAVLSPISQIPSTASTVSYILLVDSVFLVVLRLTLGVSTSKQHGF